MNLATQPRQALGGRPHLRRLGKHYHIMRLSLCNRLAYAGEVAYRSVFLALVLFVFSRLWTTAFTGSAAGSLGEFSAARLVWYLAMTESLLLAMPQLLQQVEQEVRSGAIAYMLIRPLHYLSYRYMGFIGEASVNLGMNLMVGLPVALLMVGGIPFGVWTILPILLGFVGGLTLNYLVTMSIALLAFWVEDTKPFFWIYHKLLFTLGGLLLPLDLFPQVVQKVAAVTPLTFTLYRPARLAVLWSWSDWCSLMLGQAIWILGIGLAVGWMFRRGARRFHAHGG